MIALLLNRLAYRVVWQLVLDMNIAIRFNVFQVQRTLSETYIYKYFVFVCLFFANQSLISYVCWNCYS